jgi:aminoglycoside 6'-N-acetyltransferase
VNERVDDRGEPPGAITFVALINADLPLVHAWLEADHVARWWAPTPAALAEVEAELVEMIDGTDPGEVFLVRAGGTPVGLIQRYRMADDPEWSAALSVATDPTGAAGIDYLIGEPDRVGRGLGTAMVAAFVDDLFVRYPDVTQILVDPQVDNRPSWRVLERAGFERIWTGHIEDDDPANVGPAHLYRLRRADRHARHDPSVHRDQRV